MSLNNGICHEYLFQICQSFYKLSQSNVLIGLALSERLYDSISIIDESWIDLLVDLCLFGPVPRRDERLLCCTYHRCYTSCPELFHDRFDAYVYLSDLHSIVDSFSDYILLYVELDVARYLV